MPNCHIINVYKFVDKSKQFLTRSDLLTIVIKINGLFFIQKEIQ